MKVTRSYKLKISEPNRAKLDTALYTYNRHLMYVNQWLGHLYFNGNKSFSTDGLGQLVNQAQHKARGIISAQTASKKETGNKTNVPEVKWMGCPAKLEKSKNSFDYWLKVSNQFTKGGVVRLPVKSHRCLNNALKTGWKLTSSCEFFVKNGKYYANVFVQKEVAKAVPKSKSLGCDVGYKYSVSRSDEYIGKRTDKIIKEVKIKNSERQRQGHSRKVLKSRVKQILDFEAKQAVRRSKRLNSNLIIESPKVLNNLRSGKLQGWGRNYFGNRCAILAKESGVFFWTVNPAYTSQTCSKCGHVDKQSRVKQVFKCTSCGNTLHADVNAARNIALKGTVSIEKYVKEPLAV